MTALMMVHSRHIGAKDPEIIVRSSLERSPGLCRFFDVMIRHNCENNPISLVDFFVDAVL